VRGCSARDEEAEWSDIDQVKECTENLIGTILKIKKAAEAAFFIDADD